MRRSVSALSDDYVRPKLPAALALNEVQRELVERHALAVERLRQPGPADATGKALLILLMSFSGQRGDEDTQRLRGEGYRIALEDSPAWAVERAARMWLRRENGAGDENYAFAPSPPQLRRLAALAMVPMLAEQGRLQRLLRAEPEREPAPEAERAEMIRRWDELIAGLRGAGRIHGEPPKKEAAE